MLTNSKISKDKIKKIEKALDEIRPFLATDGGDIQFVDITDDFKVKIKLLGSCEKCKLNGMTLKNGVEQIIKKYLPEIKSVIQVKSKD